MPSTQKQVKTDSSTIREIGNVKNGLAMVFEAGSTLHNFTVVDVEQIAEIDGWAHTMLHEPSGARLLYVANNDVEKTFGIGFKTPPADDTGAFHIIEHSVLCGSERFPVKEPFVNLLKTSMKTFLNAMTFPDKTIFPVSSTNETDLRNLADVYMDAVLHPLLCEKEAIFEQEGWHVETASGENGTPKLTYNGIVYNEMKGALANPETRLLNALDAALFPDTAYGHVSGGDPAHIPSLSYESLLDAYQRHYNLANSYLFLYGDLDADSFLAFLDEQYLSPESKRTAASKPQKPNPLVLQTPVRSCGNTINIACDPKQCGMAIGYGAGAFADSTRMAAIDILLDATMGTNEAPLTRALLDAGIADTAVGHLRDGVLQPYVLVVLRGMKEDAPARFRSVLEKNARKLAEGALDRKLVEASLLKDEFFTCEHSYSSTSGLVTYITALGTWLYDDTRVTQNLHFESIYKELKELLEQGYFEQLLLELFCENPHTADVVSIPVDSNSTKLSEVDAALAERERLIDAAGITELEKRVAALRAAQEQPDSPQALAALPVLTLQDVGDAPKEPEFHLENIGAMRVMRHDLNTHGIVYTERRYNATSITYDELPYLSLLSTLYGKLDTEQRSASDLATLINSRLGKLEFSVDVYNQVGNVSGHDLRLGVYSASRSDRVVDAAEISREILTQTIFDDKDRLRLLLAQRLERMERGLSAGNNLVVTNRAQAYFMPAAAIRETLIGIDHYRFLKDIVGHFDERYEALVAKLEELATRFLSDENCLMSFVGTDDELALFMESGGSFGTPASTGEKQLILPKPTQLNEAFMTPSDVTYSGLFYDHRLLKSKRTGAWNVGRKALQYDYLWNEVRVKGGAYGGSFELGRIATMGFCSWRDPHLQRTIDCFRKSADWLGRHEPSKAELEGYIISTIADIDAPKKPYVWAQHQLKAFLEGWTPKMKQALREQALATTPADLKTLATALQELIERGFICAIGNREAIERSACGFTPVDLLNE